MIPEPICVHFTLLEMGCEVARFAPRDCYGCVAYYDGTDFIKASDQTDAARLEKWQNFARGRVTPTA
jgi:hypothetical protein